MVYYGLTLNSNSQDSLFINYSLGKGKLPSSKVQGDTTGWKKPIVDIDLKVAF